MGEIPPRSLQALAVVRGLSLAGTRFTSNPPRQNHINKVKPGELHGAKGPGTVGVGPCPCPCICPHGRRRYILHKSMHAVFGLTIRLQLVNMIAYFKCPGVESQQTAEQTVWWLVNIMTRKLLPPFFMTKVGT